MFLYKSDWSKYPAAIMDLQTTNLSFLKYAATLRAMGIENWGLCLVLLNPELQGVDPFSENLTNVQKTMIALEAEKNIWYYLREICLVPQKGGPPVRFRANRGVMAFFWCVCNCINTALIMPRQTGKSIAADVFNVWHTAIAGRNVSTHLITHSDKLRQKNIRSLKDLRELIPAYMNFYQKGIDTNNTEKLTCVVFKNEYTTGVAQKDKGAADISARGISVNVLQIDEVPYCDNIDISLGAAAGSMGAAVESAEAVGAIYAKIYTTTAGKKDTREGAYAYKIIHDGMPWNEKVMDSDSRQEAWDFVAANSKRTAGRTMNITLSHRQLGYTDEWLRNRINEVPNPDRELILRDYLNVWTSGSVLSPLSVELNQIIAESRMEPIFTEIGKKKFFLDWYVTSEDLIARKRNSHLLLSLDTSDAQGSDGNGLVIQDIKTLEVLGGANVTVANILDFANWIADMLITTPNSTLVIENKSSGQSILDIIASRLIAIGINPFKRIFNRHIDGASQTELRDADISGTSNDYYEKYKKYFGFSTTGQTRPFLYGQVFHAGAENVGHLIRNRTLASQLLALIKKNGRIDHPNGGNDDMVVAWLLGNWFANYGTNLAFYGIKPGMAASMVAPKGSVLSDEDQEASRKQKQIRERITILKEKYVNEENYVRKTSIEKELKVLSTRLDSEDSINVLDDIKRLVEDEKVKKSSLADALDRHNRIQVQGSYFTGMYM
jgi:hypothetical protein